ncbi:MAG: hypothetical protein GY733_03090, partial [bacterium]|nr:hypothetical protein [bacterium]
RDIWQHARNLDRQVNDWFDRQADDAMREVSEWVMDPRGKLTEQAGAVVDYAMHKRAELSGDANRIIASAKNRDWEGLVANSVLYGLHASGLTDVRLTRNLIAGTMVRIGESVAHFNRNWAVVTDPRVAVGSQAFNRALGEVAFVGFDLATQGAFSDMREGFAQKDWLRVVSGAAQALPGMGALDNVLDVAMSGREVYRGLRTGNAAQVELGLFGVALNAY